MSDSIPDLQNIIRVRCERILKALDDCPQSGPAFYYQVVRQVLSASTEASERELHGLQRRLDEIVQALQGKKDANGKEIPGFREV